MYSPSKAQAYLNTLDLAHVCWECADTRPTYAHDTCQRVSEAIATLREVVLDTLEGEDIACGCATCEHDRQHPEDLGTGNDPEVSAISEKTP
jgi:hypothetical protein